MKLNTLTAIALAMGLLTGAAHAQQAATPAAPTAPPDLNAIPDKMPFNVPFGTPITMERAQGVIQAAIAEANKRGWPEVFSVVDPSGNLVAFARMDGAAARVDRHIRAQSAHRRQISPADGRVRERECKSSASPIS